MNRLLASAPLLLALNSTPPPPVSMDGPLRVDYRLTSGSKEETVLISGVVQAEPFRASSFEQRVVRSSEQLNLVLKPKPQPDGSVAVEVHWAEGTPEGRIIDWSPSLQGRRG